MRTEAPVYFKYNNINLFMIKKSIDFCLITTLALIVASNAQGQTFCWRDTTTRGAGYVPKTCGSGQQLIGLLCYDKCPTGYQRFGFDCHQKCLDGWRDDGLFCRLAEYGRGAGVTGWDFFKDFFGTSNTVRRCQNKIKAPCEIWGLIAYPKCKKGYSNFACCICRPAVPNCKDLGFNAGIDLSCAKKILIGSPKLGFCKDGEEKNGLLCYPKCPKNYQGVGPVCWGQPPKGWVKCGMGAASSSDQCDNTIANQITSVGTVVASIATAGTAGSAIIAQKQAAKLPELMRKLQPLINKAKELWTKSKTFRKVAQEALDIIEKAQTAYSVIKQLSGDVTGLSAAEIVSLNAEIATLFDPTGMASIIKEYSYDICSNIVVP